MSETPRRSPCGPDRLCRQCGTPFAPYLWTHVYCSESCGRKGRHEAAGHPPRQPRSRRRAVPAGVCEWCGEIIYARDGHPRQYHQRCMGEVFYARAEARAWCGLDAPDAGSGQTDPPIVCQRDGREVEVVWHGGMMRHGQRGGLLPWVTEG